MDADVTIAQITDTHGYNQSVVKIAKNLAECDYVIHTGDFVTYNMSVQKHPSRQACAECSIAECLRLIESQHVVYVPGNHDSQRAVDEFYAQPKTHLTRDIYVLCIPFACLQSWEVLNLFLSNVVAHGERYLVFAHEGPTNCQTTLLQTRSHIKDEGSSIVERAIRTFGTQILAFFHGHTHYPVEKVQMFGKTLIVNSGTTASGNWVRTRVTGDDYLVVQVFDSEGEGDEFRVSISQVHIQE